MYSKKNFIFILFIVFVFVFIAFFNFKLNPYSIFSIKRMSYINRDLPPDSIYPYIFFNKNCLCYNLSIGTSESWLIFGKSENPFNHRIVGGNIDEHIELLKAYIDVHPELKHVYIGVNLNYWNKEPQLYIEPYNGKNVKFSHLLSSLFYFPAIKTYIQNLFKIKKENDNSVFQLCTKEKYIEQFRFTKDELKQKELKYFSQLKTMVDILKKNDIEYSCIVLPINAGYLGLMRIEPLYKDLEANLKRFLVEVFPSVYDCSFVNDITKQLLTSDSNFVWRDFSHLSDYAGNLYFDIFVTKENIDKNLFFIINKENVENIIKYENQLSEKFLKNNPDYVKFYQLLANKKIKYSPICRCSSYRFEDYINYLENHLYRSDVKLEVLSECYLSR